MQRNKEGTGRIVVWMLGVTNSYTMEASFGGSNLGSRAMTHFSTTVSNSLRSKVISFIERDGINQIVPSIHLCRLFLCGRD